MYHQFDGEKQLLQLLTDITRMNIEERDIASSAKPNQI